MKAIGAVFGTILGGPIGGAIGAVAGSAADSLINGKGGPAPISTVPQVRRDDAAVQQASDDALARRRGGVADMLTGSGGAAVPQSAVGRLVVGS